MDEFAASLTEKTEQLKQAVDLRSAAVHGGTSAFVSCMLDLNQYLTSVEQKLADVRAEVQNEKACIAKSKVLQECMGTYTARMSHIENNLPVHLPGNRAATTTKSLVPASAKRGGPRSRNKENAASGSGKTHHQQQTPLVTKPAPRPLPSLPFVTTDEFETLPKYMRGRIDRTTINTIVEEINKALAEKYKIMRMTRQKMDQFQRKQWQDWKDMETDATVGLPYVTESDLKLLSDYKSSKQNNTIIVMLRHLKLVKEIRGGGKGVVRYAVL